MSKSKKTKIIIHDHLYLFHPGLQFCVSPVLGMIQAHFPEIGVSFGADARYRADIFIHRCGDRFRMACCESQQRKNVDLCRIDSRNYRISSVLADNFWLLFASRTLYGVALDFVSH